MTRDAPEKLGKYEILGRLATGGMGEIYLARQPGPGSFSRRVVVKRLLPHLAEEQEFRQMFFEEARLASLVHHQNVVRIFDVDEDGESVFIAMEHVDGVGVVELSKRAQEEGLLLPLEVSVSIVIQLCEGLHAAHELADEEGRPLKLVHRDVSPHNLMVDRSGVVKVLDFGIAKARGSDLRTRTGSVKGKAPYLSPEQCVGDPVDRRSDLFAVATVLAELLVGKRVFARATEHLTLKAIAEETIPTPRELRDDVPPEVSAVVARAHSRQPGDRYGTAAEMAAALREAMEALDLSATPEVVAEHIELDCADLLDGRASKVAAMEADRRARGALEQAFAGGREATDADADAGTCGDAPEAEERRRRPGRGALVALVVTAAIGAIGVGLVWLSGEPSGPPLVLSAPPYYEEEDLVAGLEPLASYLQETVDRPVLTRAEDDYESLARDLLAGDIHVATLGPLLFVRTRARAPDLRILAAQTHEGARTFQGYLVASSEGPVKAVSDVRGRRICYVDPSSTSGYLLARHFLREEGIDPAADLGSHTFEGSHEKVLEGVVSGRCDVGATFSGAFHSAGAVGLPTSKIHIVAVTGRAPRGVFCASPALDAATSSRLRQALLDFRPQRDLGRATVSTTFPIDGFVPVDLDDFAEIEAAARAEGILN